MNKKAQAHIAIIGANLIFGINYTVSKDIMPDYVQPYALTLMRSITGVLVFWLISMFGPKEKIDRRDMLRIIFAGLFGMALNQLLFLTGLNLSTPINSAIIMTVNPVIVLIAAALILNEKITGIKSIGIALGAIGAITIILFNNSGGIDISSDKALGNLMQLLNASSYAIYLIIAKPLMKKYHPFTVLKWCYVSALVFITPIGFNQLTQVEWSTIPTDIYLAIAYLLILITIVAFLLNMFALKHVSPTVVSTYIYSQPIIAAAFAIVLGKDKPGIIELIATAFVFTGVYLVSRNGKQKKMKS
jgi:drug/metabolite transporter (DMT)-like permease